MCIILKIIIFLYKKIILNNFNFFFYKFFFNWSHLVKLKKKKDIDVVKYTSQDKLICYLKTMQLNATNSIKISKICFCLLRKK